MLQWLRELFRRWSNARFNRRWLAQSDEQKAAYEVRVAEEMRELERVPERKREPR